MRYPIFGVVLPSSNVTVYNDDGVTPATIYEEESGGVALTGGGVSPDSSGNVIFWISDDDYPFVSYFTVDVDGEVIDGVWSAFTTVSIKKAG